jgi:hypothetical protein
MRAAVPILIAASAMVGACHKASGPNEVKQVYDNRANEIDNQAEQQPNPVAKKIYQSRADALRDEGAERKAGLVKAGTDTVPPIPAPPTD